MSGQRTRGLRLIERSTGDRYEVLHQEQFDQDVHVVLRVNDEDVVYLIFGNAATGHYGSDVKTLLKVLLALPIVETDDFTHAYVGTPEHPMGFVWTQKIAGDIQLQPVLWSSLMWDMSELSFRNRRATRSRIRLCNVRRQKYLLVAKMFRSTAQSKDMANESITYRLLEKTGLAPSFWGHLRQNGKVVGLLLEHISGRRALRRDRKACEETLKKLHELGHVHGGLHDENILIRTEGPQRGTAVLIDFSATHNAGKRSEQRDEMASLSCVLHKDSDKLDEDYEESNEESKGSDEDSSEHDQDLSEREEDSIESNEDFSMSDEKSSELDSNYSEID